MPVEEIAPGPARSKSDDEERRALLGQPMRLWSIAAWALLLGALVYITDRNPSHAWLIPNLGVWTDGAWFGPLGRWLPSFVHPLAFGLITATCWPSTALPRYAACGFWGAVNVLFEIGQHPSFSQPWSEALLTGEARGPVMEPLARYFVGGTFDTGDVVASVLGSLTAAFVLWISCKTKEHDHGS